MDSFVLLNVLFVWYHTAHIAYLFGFWYLSAKLGPIINHVYKTMTRLNVMLYAHLATTIKWICLTKDIYKWTEKTGAHDNTGPVKET